MGKRNTVQRDIVLNTVIGLSGHVTADEVFDRIRADYPNISRGTVYRNLNLLSEEGKIRRVGIPGGPDRFDFTTAEHYHVRCVRCEKVSDVDMDAIDILNECIHDSHGILFLGFDILFRGICPECLAMEKEDF